MERSLAYWEHFLHESNLLWFAVGHYKPKKSIEQNSTVEWSVYIKNFPLSSDLIWFKAAYNKQKITHWTKVDFKYPLQLLFERLDTDIISTNIDGNCRPSSSLLYRLGVFAGSKSQIVGRWAPAATRFIAYDPTLFFHYNDNSGKSSIEIAGSRTKLKSNSSKNSTFLFFSFINPFTSLKFPPPSLGYIHTRTFFSAFTARSHLGDDHEYWRVHAPYDTDFLENRFYVRVISVGPMDDGWRVFSRICSGMSSNWFGAPDRDNVICTKKYRSVFTNRLDGTRNHYPFVWQFSFHKSKILVVYRKGFKRNSKRLPTAEEINRENEKKRGSEV